MAMIKSIEHVAITVKNFDESLDFYTRILGFSIAWTSEIRERGLKIAFLESEQAKIEIFGVIDDKAIAGPTLKDTETGLKHFCLVVDDMDGIYQKLKKYGVNFSLEPKESEDGSKFAVFTDPNGIIVQLRQMK